MIVTLITNSKLEDGGGHSQSLSAIKQFKEIASQHHNIELISLSSENKKIDTFLGLKHSFYKTSFLDKLFLRFIDNSFFLELLRKFSLKSPFEKRLIDSNTDLVYFLSPNNYSKILSELNYIVTVWDLCHRDFPEFPEVRESFEFQIRENFYSKLANASLIITDSDKTSDNLSSRYGLDKERILPMPFSFPSSLKLEPLSAKNVLSSDFISEGYFFYPAQYWAHKNHFRILDSLKYLNKVGLKINFVFCGSDKGNLDFLKRVSKDFGISSQIQFLNFVSDDDLSALYQNCKAVVMPSFFGPTNIPPIEAWSYKKPLVYSNLLYTSVSDSSLKIDPFSTESMANALQKIHDNNFDFQHLIAKGLEELTILKEKRILSESSLRNFLLDFEHKLSCWK